MKALGSDQMQADTVGNCNPQTVQRKFFSGSLKELVMDVTVMPAKMEPEVPVLQAFHDNTERSCFWSKKPHQDKGFAPKEDQDQSSLLLGMSKTKFPKVRGIYQ